MDADRFAPIIRELTVSNDRRWLLLTERGEYIHVSDLDRPERPTSQIS